MPFYQYRCTVCKHLEEHFQGINSKPERECEMCKSLSKRIITGSNFIMSDKKPELSESQREKNWNNQKFEVGRGDKWGTQN